MSDRSGHPMIMNTHGPSMAFMRIDPYRTCHAPAHDIRPKG